MPQNRRSPVKATKSLKLGREVRFRRSVDHAHWLLIEADPEVASFCEEPVWAADGPGGSPLADLCVRRVDGATEFLCVERSERGDALAHQALKGVFGAAGELPKHDRGSNFGGSRALGQCVAGDWPRLPVATRARAGLGGEG